MTALPIRDPRISPTKKNPQETEKTRKRPQQIKQTAFLTSSGPKISLSIFQGEKMS